MTAAYRPAPAPRQPPLSAGKLWAGGLATAVVAALIAAGGILVGRGIFGVNVLAPKGAGVWGDARTVWYALGAAAAGITATAVVHLLLLYAPRPMRFFGWVMAMATVVSMAGPFVADEDRASSLYTATLNLVLGVAIGSLVAGSARAAVRPVAPVQPNSQTYGQDRR
jgi:hypothetical protein